MSKQEFLRALSPEEIELVGSKVKNLYLNVEDLEFNEVPVLKDFLSSMPSLREVVFFYNDDEYIFNKNKFKNFQKVAHIIHDDILPRGH